MKASKCRTVRCQKSPRPKLCQGSCATTRWCVMLNSFSHLMQPLLTNLSYIPIQPQGTVIDAADDQQVKPKLKIKAGKKNNKSSKDDDYDDYDVKEDFEEMPDSTSAQKILNQARQQRDEVANEDNLPKTTAQNDDSESDDNDEYDDEVGEDGEQGDDYEATDLSEAEEAVVSKFLNAGRAETRTLADIIMEKLKEKDAMASASQEELSQSDEIIPPKVMEVFTSVGKLLHHYKSGKLPKVCTSLYFSSFLFTCLHFSSLLLTSLSLLFTKGIEDVTTSKELGAYLMAHPS